MKFKIRCTPSDGVGVKIRPIMMDDEGNNFYVTGSSFVSYPTNWLTRWFASKFLPSFEEQVAREVAKWTAYCEALQRTHEQVPNVKWSGNKI